MIAPAARAAAPGPWGDGGALPTPHAQAAVAVDPAGAVHLLGGYGDGGTTSFANHDVLGVDGGWTVATALPAPTRAAAAAVGKDGVIYLAGGYDDVANSELGTAWAFGLDGGWEPLPDMPRAAGWETSGDIGADGKLYVFGGEGPEVDDAGSSLGLTNSRTMIYDPVGKAWTEGAPMPGRRKQHRVVRGSDGLFYVIGGEDEHEVAVATVLVYHPTTSSWTTGPSLVTPPLPDGGFDAGADAAADAGEPHPINSFAVAPTPDRSFFVVAGGSDRYGNGESPFFDSVYVFDVGAQTWTRYAVPLPMGRRELVAAFQSCTLHVLGGSTGANALDNHDTSTTIAPLGPDTDGDGMPDACDPDDDNDGTPDAQDCAPKDGASHPGGTEICDGKDNDCNGTADEGLSCPEPSGNCDASGGCDGGSGGFDATVSGGDSGTGAGSGGDGGDGADGGSDSGGCGCELVSDRASSGAGLLAALGAFVAVARRRRRRRR